MTTRDISAANITATTSQVIRAIVFVRLAFASGVQRYHTEIGPRTAVHPVFGSEVYTGLGTFGGITTDVSENIGNAQDPLKIALSGVDAYLLANALDSSDYYWRDFDMMFGFDDASNELIDDPEVIFSGFMDKVDVTLDQGKADIILSCETRSAKSNGNSDLRFTDEQLQFDQSGDLAGEYIYRMADLQLKIGGGSVDARSTNRGFNPGVGISG